MSAAKISDGIRCQDGLGDVEDDHNDDANATLCASVGSPRKERNGMADSLAAMGRDHGRSGVVFVTPPGGLVSRLEEERAMWLSERVVDNSVSGRERESVVLFDPGG
ncbi:hypothetical protein V6N13_029485 [Hibiscus sabdariffa]